MLWPYLDHDAPSGFAHRGGSVHAPENTVAAFQHAVDLGYRYLETDVHCTRDGVLVAFHDSGLERLAGMEGAIADHRWSDLRHIDLGSGATIPTLDELLSTFPAARFNIDPKTDDAVLPLARAILSHDAVDRVGVGSFSDERIARLRREIGPRLCTSPGPRTLLRLWAASLGCRPGGRLRAPSQELPRHGAVQIPPSYGPLRLTGKQVERFHCLDLEVHVWTINDESEMRRLLDLGVDAVMTDRTGLLKNVMLARGEW